MTRLFILAAAMVLISAEGCAAATKSMNQENTPHPRQHSVILVHGVWDQASKMYQMADYLRDEGFTVYTPTLTPSWGEVGIDELSRQLSVFVDANLRPGEKFDLVGFSMGGLICRYYLQRMDGLRRVDRFVSLGAPNHGSLWAYTMSNAGCIQMRPGSKFLNDLNGDCDALGKIKYTSIWTRLDLMILPSSSSRMPVGRNVPTWVSMHPFLVWSPRIIRMVAGLLKS